MSLLRGSPRIGVALAPGRLAAVTASGDCHDVAFDADAAAALVTLQRVTGLARARVAVTLVPPLVEVRRLTLPPLSAGDLRRILARDAPRYFLNAREPLVAAVEPSRAFAAAAGRSLVEAIERGVAEAGWVLDAVRPAHGAWLAAAPGSAQITVVLTDHVEVLTRAGTAGLDALRRLPLGDRAGTEADPVLAAARYAWVATGGPELISDGRLAAEHRGERRAAGMLAAAAAACLVLTALVELWGARRGLDALRARRDAMRPAVAQAMAIRDSLGAVRGALETLASLEATAPHWSGFLTDVADYLPSGAHLLALRAAGDSAVLQGVAREAAGAFEAIRQMPEVAGVRAEAPIRQEIAPDGTPREYFALGTRVRP